METKEHIIAQATSMFLEQGIKAVRMDDIAAYCGVSKRTIYEMFADRADLIRQCIEYRFKDCDQKTTAEMKNAENVIEEYWIFFGTTQEFRRNNISLMTNLRRFYPNILKEFFHSTRDAIYRNEEVRLRRGIDEGLFIPQLDVEYFAKALSNYIHGLSIIDSGNDITGESANSDSFRKAVIVFLRGISTEKGRNYIDNKLLLIS